MNDVLRIARLKIALQRAFLGRAILIFTSFKKHWFFYKFFMVFQVNIRIARPRNALWRAILRWAILSTSFIRIARPIYFVFFCADMPFN